MPLFLRKTLFFLVSVLPLLIFSQKGKDGNYVVNSLNTQVNEYTSLTNNISAGDTAIKVSLSSLNKSGYFNANLNAGDLIMIIQMQGATIKSNVNDITFGEVLNFNTAGAHEFAEVKSVPDSVTILLKCPSQNSYNVNGKTQIVRVPRYKKLTVSNGNSVIAQAWDGSVGGVVAIETSEDILVQGEINVNGQGFRGGKNIASTPIISFDNYFSTDSTNGAPKGESIAGSFQDYINNGYPYGRGAPANGGGGGNNNNSGGGGGSNITQSINTWNGDGIPDTLTVIGWSNAWNLEAVNFANNNSPGGGRGGYSHSTNDQSALITGPNDASWGGDSRRNIGGKGGRSFVFNFLDQRLFLGGGGGAGHGDSGFAGEGGNGGGIIYLLSHGAVYGGGVISANGSNGGSSTNNVPSDGAGGGGGAGNIIINAKDTVYNIILTANGGNGGNEINNSAVGRGPGGGGSGGFIAISKGNPLFITNGGANGTTASSSLNEFLPNGATKGSEGYSSYTLGNSNIKNSVVTFESDTLFICSGDSVQLIAYNTHYVPKKVIYPNWYDAAVGGNLIRPASDSSNFYVKNISQPITYWADVCPGSFSRTSITIMPDSSPSFTLSNYSVCEGTQIIISNILPDTTGTFLSPAVQYSSSNNIYFINTSITDSGYHQIKYYRPNNGCNDTATATIYVANAPDINFPNIPTICYGADSVVLPFGTPTNGWFQFDYPYSNYNAINGNAGIVLFPSNFPVIDKVPPADTNTVTYPINYFYMDSKSCTNSTTGSITITTSIPVSQSAYADVCPHDPSFTLSNGTPAGGQYFINGNLATNFNPSTLGPGSYTVKYEYSSGGCMDSANVIVNVLSQPNVLLNTTSNVCLSDPSFVLSGGTPIGGSYLIDGVNGNNFNPSIAGVGTHNISYIYSDGNCVDTAYSTITVISSQTVSLTSFNPICENDPSFNLSGGSPAGGTYYINNIASTTFDPSMLGSGSYTIKYVFPSSGTCKDSTSQNITVNPTPQIPTISSNGNTTFCIGDSVQLICNGNYNSYLWSNGNTNDTIVVTLSNSYSVTVSDNNNCSNTSAGTIVIVNNLPNAIITTNGNTSFCTGDSVILSASGGNSYVWSTNATSSNITVYTSNNYSVTVTDNNNCSDTASINISVNAKPNVAFAFNSSGICDNTQPFTITGGTPVGGTYSGAGITSNTFNPTIAGAGTHTITYTYSNGGCSDSSNQSITVNSAPPAPFITPTGANPFCSGQSLTLVASGTGSNFLWTNGETNSTITVSNSGTISVTIFDQNNCSSASTPLNYNEIVIDAILTSPNIAGTYQVSYEQNDGSINLAVNGGNAPYTYIWNNNSTTEDLNQLAEGTYSVIVTDNNGCTTSASILLIKAPKTEELEMPQGFSPNGDGKNDSFIIKGIQQYPNNEIHILNRWGNEVYSTVNYNNDWNGKNNAGTDLSEGTYFVIFKDVNGVVKLNGYVELRR